MTIPTYDQFISPLLLQLAKHPSGLSTAQACEAVANAYGIAPEARSTATTSKGSSALRGRAWSTRSRRARASQRPARGLALRDRAIGRRLA